MHATRTILLTLIAAAAIAPNASAAQRYAEPGGQNGGACIAASPCNVAQAIGGAQAGDEVILAPGTYALGNNLIAPGQITIHGVAGQPRPRLVFSGPGQFGMTVNPATTLRHLEVDQQQTAVGASAIKADSATLDQVVAKGSAKGATAAIRGNSTIRNSVVVSSAPGTSAISAVGGATALRNVTAVANGTGSAAIYAWAGAPAGTVTVHATNVIAAGGPGGQGLLATTDSSGAVAMLTMRNSSWMGEHKSGTNAHIVDAGGNQHSVPVFVDAATGDYHQAAGSPTVDAGLSDPIDNAAFDLDGDPRAFGTTDIGADEFVPPQPGPTPPSPTPVPPPPTQPAQPFAGVDLVSRRLTYARRAIAVRLRCPAGTVGRCSGRTTLTAGPRRASSRRVTLGRARFSIAPGNQATVKVRVTRAGRRLLNRALRLRGRAVTVARDGASQSKTIRAAVTIHRRHR
jgi:hypothetical protein